MGRGRHRSKTIARKEPKRKPRHLTNRRRKGIQKFFYHISAHKKQNAYGNVASFQWSKALIKFMGDPPHYGLLPQDVAHWYRVEPGFFVKAEAMTQGREYTQTLPDTTQASSSNDESQESTPDRDASTSPRSDSTLFELVVAPHITRASTSNSKAVSKKKETRTAPIVKKQPKRVNNFLKARTITTRKTPESLPSNSDKDEEQEEVESTPEPIDNDSSPTAPEPATAPEQNVQNQNEPINPPCADNNATGAEIANAIVPIPPRSELHNLNSPPPFNPEDDPFENISPDFRAFLQSLFFIGNTQDALLYMVSSNNCIIPSNLETLQLLTEMQRIVLEKSKASGTCPGYIADACTNLVRATETLYSIPGAIVGDILRPIPDRENIDG